jgi:hypothetical protein
LASTTGNEEKFNEEIYSDDDGGGARAGINRHNGERSNPGAGRGELSRTVAKRDTDHQKGSLQRNDGRAWLWSRMGLGLRSPRRQLPMRPVLATNAIKQYQS